MFEKSGFLSFSSRDISIVFKGIPVHSFQNGSRTIGPEENCPPTPKLTLGQTATLTSGGNFSRGQLSGCPPTLKLTLTLIQTPTLTGGQLSGYLSEHFCSRPTTLLKTKLWHRCFPVNFAKSLRASFLKEHFS